MCYIFPVSTKQVSNAKKTQIFPYIYLEFARTDICLHTAQHTETCKGKCKVCLTSSQCFLFSKAHTELQINANAVQDGSFLFPNISHLILLFKALLCGNLPMTDELRKECARSAVETVHTPSPPRLPSVLTQHVSFKLVATQANQPLKLCYLGNFNC